jgi:hypothetical protein
VTRYVEFHLGLDGEVDELFFHEPNGAFTAGRGCLRRLAGRECANLAHFYRSRIKDEGPLRSKPVQRIEL